MALTNMPDKYPEGEFFEHDGLWVRMPGARDAVSLSISRDTLLNLGVKAGRKLGSCRTAGVEGLRRRHPLPSGGFALVENAELEDNGCPGKVVGYSGCMEWPS